MSQLCDIVTVSAIAQIHTEIFTLDQNLPSRFVLPLRCPVVAPTRSTRLYDPSRTKIMPKCGLYALDPLERGAIPIML